MPLLETRAPVFHNIIAQKIKRIVTLSLFLIAVAGLALQNSSLAAEPASLIPEPAGMDWRQGDYHLNGQSCLLGSSDGAVSEALKIAAYLRPATGFSLPVRKVSVLPGSEHNAIELELNPRLKGTLGTEGYELESTPDGVRITAAATAGLFYGGQTLRQLLPPAIFANTVQSGIAWTVPCCRIVDKPRFAWRAFMLDYSRHFLDESYTMHLLDLLAMHKFNILHMHLTDDDGWRIEIKRYPKLTEVGAWRGTDCALPNTRGGETFARYGGYFTQEQIRKIVTYAAERHIEVLPEIDLPGHALAICTAYPETLPDAGPKATNGKPGTVNAISPAKEANYQMVEAIISEVAELFPFEYIHIGGDEVNAALWKDCLQIQSLIQRENLGGVGGAQTYFTKRLETIIAAHHREMIGWNEILNGKLARTTAIMAWTGAGAGFQAARMGFPVVMAPRPHTYFSQSEPNANDEPPGPPSKLDSEQCYSFDPLANKNLTPEQASHIMGVEGCLWGEFLYPWTSKAGWADFKTSGTVADYRTLPRLCALSEVAWTPQERRNYEDFDSRLGNGHLQRLAAAGYLFRVTPPDAIIQKDGIHIVPAVAGTEIRYTTDGTDPFKSSTAQVWSGQPIQSKPGQFRARAYFQGKPGPLHAGAHPEIAGNSKANGV